MTNRRCVHDHSSLIFKVWGCDILLLCWQRLKMDMLITNMTLKAFTDTVLLLPLILFKRNLLEGCLACWQIRGCELFACWETERLCLQTKRQLILECQDRLLASDCIGKWQLELFLTYPAICTPTWQQNCVSGNRFLLIWKTLSRFPALHIG